MDYKDIFENIIDGKPPKVKSLKSIKHATSNIGIITAVKWKSDGSPNGIEVKFPGVGYNSWFWGIPKGKRDERSKYIDELELYLDK